MLPLKKILCPTDFSKPSYQALGVATELASHFYAQLYLVHIVPLVPVTADATVPLSVDITAYRTTLEASAKKQLQKLCQRRVPKRVKSCTPMVATGYTADEIIHIAKEEKVDLIVIGTRGLTGLRHLLLGSTAERVIQLAPCPVLTVGRRT